MSDINFNDCFNEQRFIDININDTDTDTNTSVTPSHSKKSNSIFNFINNSATASSPSNSAKKSLNILTKSKSVSLTRSRPVLTATVSDPTIKAPVAPASRTLVQAADILLSKLNDVDLNSSENEDDEDDEKLNELSRNVQSLKSYLASPSFAGHSSTPLRAASTSSTNNLTEEDSGEEDLNKTLNSVSDQNDETLSFDDESQEVKENQKEDRSFSTENKRLADFRKLLLLYY